jgi:hypothetical protein
MNIGVNVAKFKAYMVEICDEYGDGQYTGE